MKMTVPVLFGLMLLVFVGGLFPVQNQDTWLVPGDPPLTLQMASQLNAFFEWVLDISLSPQQRELVKGSLMNVWREHNKEEMDGMLTILKTQADLEKATPADRSQLRELLQTQVLKSLRAQPGDETSRTLVKAYESAHPPGAGANGAPRGGPVRVAGKWHNGGSSGVDYYNPATGQWAAPSGTGMSYEIFASGQYIYSGLLQSTMYNCTISFYVYEKGTWSIEGSMIRLVPVSGMAKNVNTCSPSSNYEKSKTFPPRSIPYRFKTNEYTGEEELCLTEASGEICFRRQASTK